MILLGNLAWIMILFWWVTLRIMYFVIALVISHYGPLKILSILSTTLDTIANDFLLYSIVVQAVLICTLQKDYKSSINSLRSHYKC